jgi:hypothetical protein
LADALTRYKLEGHTLLVHLIEQSSTTSNGQVVRCGLSNYQGKQTCACPAGQQQAPHLNSGNAYAELAQYFQQLCAEAYAALNLAQQQQAEAARPEGYAYAYAPQAGYAASLPPAPAAGPAGYYTTNAYGLPVNTANGHVDTERRAVHLANLSRKTRAKDVRQLVERKKIGRVLAVDLHTDPAEGRCKGSAVVHFATADEANYAVAMLSDYEWLGERKIRARLAKEAAAVGERAPMPVIVNGTTYGGQ